MKSFKKNFYLRLTKERELDEKRKISLENEHDKIFKKRVTVKRNVDEEIQQLKHALRMLRNEKNQNALERNEELELFRSSLDRNDQPNRRRLSRSKSPHIISTRALDESAGGPGYEGSWTSTSNDQNTSLNRFSDFPKRHSILGGVSNTAPPKRMSLFINEKLDAKTEANLRETRDTYSMNYRQSLLKHSYDDKMQNLVVLPEVLRRGSALPDVQYFKKQELLSDETGQPKHRQNSVIDQLGNDGVSVEENKAVSNPDQETRRPRNSVFTKTDDNQADSPRRMSAARIRASVLGELYTDLDDQTNKTPNVYYERKEETRAKAAVLEITNILKAYIEIRKNLTAVSTVNFEKYRQQLKQDEENAASKALKIREREKERRRSLRTLLDSELQGVSSRAKMEVTADQRRATLGRSLLEVQDTKEVEDVKTAGRQETKLTDKPEAQEQSSDITSQRNAGPGKNAPSKPTDASSVQPEVRDKKDRHISKTKKRRGTSDHDEFDEFNFPDFKYVFVLKKKDESPNIDEKTRKSAKQFVVRHM